MVTLARATVLARPGGRTLALQRVVQGPLAEPVGSLEGLLPGLRADEVGRGDVRQGLRGLAIRVRGRARGVPAVCASEHGLAGSERQQARTLPELGL